ncbi:hypothetical protein [Ornithinimicrobium sp. INDO-MA30-4]|uniref:hypothetical protein n=1 Tax=Ornithinimicrobium sp. INDO-MA30-4 TaxID=2908651 RepID=UPI001F35FDDE|nr:hypothetical protein [Ornithinimicrobium sp. INDO-MA30-4]UJH70975.1 hypothetical protein L0A91_03245 [Ornithinimicrobium sp. INDO-MA30-4]
MDSEPTPVGEPLEISAPCEVTAPTRTGDDQVDALLAEFHRAVSAPEGDSVEAVSAAQRGLQARLASS